MKLPVRYLITLLLSDSEVSINITPKIYVSSLREYLY
jgi:hypothetical protein